MIATTLLLLISACGVFCIGYCFGLIAGVKDTERRWSEAVGRADEARRVAQTERQP